MLLIDSYCLPGSARYPAKMIIKTNMKHYHTCVKNVNFDIV